MQQRNLQIPKFQPIQKKLKLNNRIISNKKAKIENQEY